MAIELPPQITNGHNWLAWIVGCSDDDFGGFSIYVSLDGTTYTKLMTSTAKCTMGKLLTPMPVSAGTYDDTLSVDVDFSDSPGDNVIGTTEAGCLEGVNMCIIGDEWCSFRDATLIGVNQYRLTGWRREWYDTDQAAHGVGTQMGIVPLNIPIREFPKELIGQTIFTKTVPINLYGVEADISTVPALGHYLEGRGLRGHNDPGQSYMGVAAEAIQALELCELRADGLVYKGTRNSMTLLGLAAFNASAGGKVFLVRLGCLSIPAAATPTLGYDPATLLYPSSVAGQLVSSSEVEGDYPVAMVGTYDEIFVDCPTMHPSILPPADHATLLNLEWSAAGHNIDTDVDLSGYDLLNTYRITGLFGLYFLNGSWFSEDAGGNVEWGAAADGTIVTSGMLHLDTITEFILAAYFLNDIEQNAGQTSTLGHLRVLDDCGLLPMVGDIEMNLNDIISAGHISINYTGGATPPLQDSYLYIGLDLSGVETFGIYLEGSYSAGAGTQSALRCDLTNTDAARIISALTCGLDFNVDAYGVVDGIWGNVFIRGDTGADARHAGGMVFTVMPLREGTGSMIFGSYATIDASTAAAATLVQGSLIGYCAYITTDEFNSNSDFETLIGFQVQALGGGGVNPNLACYGVKLDIDNWASAAYIYSFWCSSGLATMYHEGPVGLGTNAPTAKLDINSDILRLRTSKTPANAHDSGNVGDVCWDANYFYICTAANYWTRSALAHW